MRASRSCGRRRSAPNRCPAARELAPCLVHVRVRRNCRVAPRLLLAISGRLGRPLDHAGDRMPDSTPGALEVVPVAEGRELPALLTALKAHLEHFGPDEVVVLSPFGEQSSLVGRFLAREPANKEERQLRELLSGERAVAWRSIFKGKGLDAAAVVLTDITPDAAAWADERRLSWNDLLYVGMTRAQYGCTVLRSEGAPWSGELDAELRSERAQANAEVAPLRPGVRVVGGGGGAAAAMAKMAGSATATGHQNGNGE